MAQKAKKGPENDQSSTSKKHSKLDREDAKMQPKLSKEKAVGWVTTREQNWKDDPKQLKKAELDG